MNLTAHMQSQVGRRPKGFCFVQEEGGRYSVDCLRSGENWLCGVFCHVQIQVRAGSWALVL